MLNSQNLLTENHTYGEESLYSASDGGQIIVQGDFLRIGVGGIRLGKYVDHEGNVQSGMIVHLSFFVRDQQNLEQDLDVYEGQIIIIDRYRVRVTDINNDDRLVVVKISEPID